MPTLKPTSVITWLTTVPQVLLYMALSAYCTNAWLAAMATVTGPEVRARMRAVALRGDTATKPALPGRRASCAAGTAAWLLQVLTAPSFCGARGERETLG